MDILSELQDEFTPSSVKTPTLLSVWAKVIAGYQVTHPIPITDPSQPSNAASPPELPPQVAASLYGFVDSP